MEWKFIEPAPGEDFVELNGLFDVVRVAGSKYFVMNNVWGATTPQTLRVDVRNGDFTVVRAEHEGGDQVASYPAIVIGCHWGLSTDESGMPIEVGKLTTLTSDWSFVPIDSGKWNAAYDLWFSPITDSKVGYPGGAEIMIWLDRCNAFPDGSLIDIISLSGAEWEVWFEGKKREWVYIAYISKRPIRKVSSFDLLAFIHDCIQRGWIQKSWYLHAVEAGFEIWEGGAGLASMGFSVSLS